MTGAAFYYDYKDKQLLGYRVIPPFGNLPALVGIPKSRVWGAELSLGLRPLGGLSVTVNGTYVSSKVLRDPPLPTGPFGSAVTFVGQPFPYTPRWQGVLDAEYRFALDETHEIFAGGSLTARSGTRGALFSDQPADRALEDELEIEGYGLIDLRAGLEEGGQTWRLEFWGRNITNKFYKTNTTRVGDWVTRFAGQPASYGVTLRYRFGG